MRASSSIYALAAVLGLGCDRPVSEPGPLKFPAPQTHDTGDAPIAFGLTTAQGTELDDGFGSALIAESGFVWIGAPHGAQGRVYTWTDSVLTLAIEGEGRAGSHLALTPSGPWIGAPLAGPSAGQVIRPDGTVVETGEPNAGIALSSAGGGAYGFANGWSAADGRSETLPARPAAIAEANGIIGAGMPFGPVSFTAGTGSIERLTPSDEAGFALLAVDIDGDGTSEWLLGAPGAGRVTAHRSADLGAMRTWSGAGRFGSAMAVCDLNGDGTDDLVVGAPLDGENGRIHWFPSFSEASVSLEVEWPEARGRGTALDCRNGALFIGSPGDHEVFGRVERIQRTSDPS